MIDIKYHIASIVAVFLALGLGILIGSTIVGDEILVDQQKKMLDRLEEQFTLIKDRETQLISDNNYKDEVINNYENFSQILLPPLVKGRLEGEKVAIVVTNNTDIPSGLINTLTIAGAKVVSKTVVLTNISLANEEILTKLKQYYNINEDIDNIEAVIRGYIGGSVSTVLLNADDYGIIEFLQENQLINFTGDYETDISKVIILGGSNSLENNYAADFDTSLIQHLDNHGLKVYGVEKSKAEHSYMSYYQKFNITTIDNIDLSPGQISLIFAIEGELGHYGTKATAQKFMPLLPIESLGSGE
ncbi:MAG: copper transporter [Syntrophomonadaceae bacterium]|nr:copper transporter [Syntrophomonadaceae bacterium]